MTTDPDESGQNRFVAGDGRVNEHAVLTGMHTVWMREHNRLCDIMDSDANFAGMSVDEMFDRARQVRPAPHHLLVVYLMCLRPQQRVQGMGSMASLLTLLAALHLRVCAIGAMGKLQWTTWRMKAVNIAATSPIAHCATITFHSSRALRACRRPLMSH